MKRGNNEAVKGNKNSPHLRASTPLDHLSYYPAFINLYEKQCVVVGGGRVAERKVLSLLRSGANVKVISFTLTDVLKRQKNKGNIRHIERNYKEGDLKEAFLVVAATSDEKINREVSADAPCLVNVVDKPEMANFIVPSVVKRGRLTIAISTSGSSPAMAKEIRRELELLYGRDFGQFLDFLRHIRELATKNIHDKKIRRRFLKEIISSEIINTLRENGAKEAREMVINKFKLYA